MALQYMSNQINQWNWSIPLFAHAL